MIGDLVSKGRGKSRREHLLCTAALRRIMMATGATTIARDAIAFLQEWLDKEAKAVFTNAFEIAKHQKQTKVTRDDVELALKLHEEKVHVSIAIANPTQSLSLFDKVEVILTENGAMFWNYQSTEAKVAGSRLVVPLWKLIQAFWPVCEALSPSAFEDDLIMVPGKNVKHVTGFNDLFRVLQNNSLYHFHE